MQQIGEAQTGNAGYAKDDTAVETGMFYDDLGPGYDFANVNTERSWSWMEEVAEMIDRMTSSGQWGSGIAV